MALYLFIFVLSFLIPTTASCMHMSPSEPGIPANPPCSKCDPAMPDLTLVGPGYKEFDSDVQSTDPTTNCISRTLTCEGIGANIEINGDDGLPIVPNVITITCNAAGTAWEYQETAITALQCAVYRP